MRAFTLRTNDEELYKRLVLDAQVRGWSINSTANLRLRETYGLTGKKKRRDLSWMKGLWTKEEGERFDKYIEDQFEKIDAEDWK